MNCMKGACCTLLSLLFSLTVSSGCKEKDMSMKMNEPHNIKGVISYKRSFGDLNDTHLSVAKKIEFVRWLLVRKQRGWVANWFR